MAKRPSLELLRNTETPAEGPRTLTERAYVQLREDILVGRLRAGEKLRVEHLKANYGVGAGTLREAMTRLVSDALVEAEGHRGFRVREMNLQDFADLTAVRIQLEIPALRESVRNGDDAWRSRVLQAYVEMSPLEQPLRIENRTIWEEANTRFHDALLSAYHSPWTQKLLTMLARYGERYRRQSLAVGDPKRNVHQEHEDIFNAAMEGNDTRAALALEAHINATLELLTDAARRGQELFAANGHAGNAHIGVD